MAKKTGWDPTNRNNARPSEEERENHRAYKQAQREPYDPNHEVVMGTHGPIAINPNGTALVLIERIAYKGKGQQRIRTVKIIKNPDDGTERRAANLGFLFPEAALRVATLIADAVAAIPEKK